MKKFFVFSVAAFIALSMAGCATKPVVVVVSDTPQAAQTAPATQAAPAASSGTASKGLNRVPSFVNEAFLNASEDVLIGIGTYKVGNDTSKIGTGKTFAETRARADLSRQLTTIVKDMANDYTATSELDPGAAVSFQETITQTLSKAELKGARTVKMDTDDNGLLWVVMEYSKSAASAEVNQAANAAKLAVPAAATFNALQRMETAFSKEAGGGPIPVGD